MQPIFKAVREGAWVSGVQRSKHRIFTFLLPIHDCDCEQSVVTTSGKPWDPARFLEPVNSSVGYLIGYELCSASYEVSWVVQSKCTLRNHRVEGRGWKEGGEVCVILGLL